MTAVVFDVDGVLLDSLAAHLKFARKVAADLGLNIKVPSPRVFKSRIALAGGQISPMFNFFRSLDFSEADARHGDERYLGEFAEFAKRELVEVFEGVPEMLQYLKTYRLGIVTSNAKSIVKDRLCDYIEHFELVFTREDFPKAEALREAAARWGVSVYSLLFVGDQLSDQHAARKAGTQFLGVSYGWGISSDATGFDIAETPEEIVRFVQERGECT